MAFNPLLLAAMSDVEPEEAGLASGRREHGVHDGRRARPRRPGQPRRPAHASLVDSGESLVAALNGGYHLAFVVGAAFAASGAALGGLLLRTRLQAPAHHGEEAIGAPAVAEAE